MEVITAKQAARLIEDGMTVSTGGFGSVGHHEAITKAIAARFEAEGHPRDLTLMFGAAQGDRKKAGLNRLAKPGLIGRTIGGFYGFIPEIGKLIVDNQIEAHNWPQGIMSQLFRAIGGGQPGLISKIGMDTFIDPNHLGGRLNDVVSEGLVRRIGLDGEDYLFYPTRPINVALIRGTSADADGNLTMDREANNHDSLVQAQAAHNSGGIVVAQVQKLVPRGALDPKLVKVPGILVDYVVLADPEDHWQTYDEAYNPAYAGNIAASDVQDRPVTGALDRFLIVHRAYEELARLDNPVVNLGIGIPADLGPYAKQRGFSGFTLTIESGPIGGVPAHGLSFGASSNPQAIIDHSSQFDFYDGGGIDLAFLGFAEVDCQGNVNVSRFGNRLSGVGGFVNISQSAKRVVYCGTFNTGGLDVEVRDGALRIVREGAIAKFVAAVGHLSFNGDAARRAGKPVMFVTERATFRLGPAGLEVTEVWHGIDLNRDVLDLVPFDIRVADDFHVKPLPDDRPGRSVPIMPPAGWTGERYGAAAE